MHLQCLMRGIFEEAIIRTNKNYQHAYIWLQIYCLMFALSQRFSFIALELYPFGIFLGYFVV